MKNTLEQLNAAPLGEAVAMLESLYADASWIATAALAHRPFRTLAQLKQHMAQVVRDAGREAQLQLIASHAEPASLPNTTTHEWAQLQQLHADYHARFGFPFVLALPGPRGKGLTCQQVIGALVQRLQNPPDFELQEGLRNLHRIAELRLNDQFSAQPTLGDTVWDWHEHLAQYSDPGYAEKGQLTVTYLTEAHRACAAFLCQTMRECGFDEVSIDAVGNVVGKYLAAPGADGKTLLTGSHYDTVRNAGKYDGRLGIFTPLACVLALSRQGRRLPFHLEVVGFAEEEGQRYKAMFLGSGALIGDFKPEWLAQTDVDGISMQQAMHNAGLNPDGIADLQRRPADYLGFVEVHIEQGPVLNALGLPLGIVTSINGSVRYLGEVSGLASHAGTTPMQSRRDAAMAVAELGLYMERRAAQDPDSVATMGMLQVPSGSINVVPGRCLFSLDMRAPHDGQRDALVADVLAELQAICSRRGVHYTLELTERADAAPSAPAWQQRWERALQALGLPLHRLPSGAGHDAMKLHKVMPQAMLFVRGQNAGISHNPLESTTSDDIELAVQAFLQLLNGLALPGLQPTPH